MSEDRIKCDLVDCVVSIGSVYKDNDAFEGEHVRLLNLQMNRQLWHKTREQSPEPPKHLVSASLFPSAGS